MQIMIDTDADALRMRRVAVALLLLDETMLDDEDVSANLEALLMGMKPIKTPTPPPIGTPAPACDPAPLPPGNTPVAPVEHPKIHPDADKFVPPAPPEDVPAGTQNELPPPAIFGGVLPLDTQTGTPPIPPVNTSPPAPAPLAPVVPLAASAPTVTAGAAPSVANAASVGGERDSKGYLWDARIHSETKKKNADGTWRFRRNLDEKVKTSVLAELNAALGGAAPAPTFQPAAGVTSAVPVPPAPAAVPVPPAPTAPVPVPPVPAAGNVPAPPVTATVVPFPNQTPAAPAVPVPPAANVGVPNAGLPDVVSSFRELIQLVNISISRGAMTQAQLSEACAHVKVESVTGLASQPALIPTMYQYMKSRGWLVTQG